MMKDMMKHQSFTHINKHFISNIKTKYSNNISVGKYITEKLLDSNIHTGFLYYTNYTPFYDISQKNKDFNICNTNSDKISLYSSIFQSKINNTPGLILSTNNYNYTSLLKNTNIKVILLSFFDKYKYVDNTINIFPEYYKVNTSYRFPILMEYMLKMSDKVPVHIKINNDILEDPVDLNDIDYFSK